MRLSFYNTLSKSIQELNPVKDGTVSIYSCGPTVYDRAHIGNMRAFLFADVLQRTARVIGGYDVRWVMNITDIDDKTIRNSTEGGERWHSGMGKHTSDPKHNLAAYTQYYEARFIEDIATIGILRSDMIAMPRATDYIPAMQDLIRLIHQRGFAYVADGSVYFNLTAWQRADTYGKLFKVDAENFREGVRIDADEYERDSVSDFVLWKGAKDGEPSWDFEIDGVNVPGRPGWHIECSAMSKVLLDVPFDIHTGGVDLRFPHHEDEIAQSKAGYGVEPAQFWCHNEFLEVEGKKMSKSLGNFFTLHDLTSQGLDALDIRFAMLSAHYASVYNFTFDGIAAARKARMRVQEFIYDVWSAAGTQSADVAALRDAVFGELATDIHTPKALAQIFSFINKADGASYNAETRLAMLAFLEELNGIFAVWHIGERPAEEAEVIPEFILALAERRLNAKKQRDFAAADALRAEITAAGYTLKDTKDGYTIERG